MEILIAVLPAVLFVVGCINKGTKKDPCWRCKKDKCEECEYWRKMTNGKDD